VQSLSPGVGFWEGEDEFRPYALGADDVDIFIVSLNDFTDNGKSQASSFFVFSTGKITLVKPLPDFA